MRYVFTARAAWVGEMHSDVNWRIDPATRRGVCDRVSLGWFLLLEGSHERLRLGDAEPNIAAGDLVRVTMEKV